VAGGDGALGLVEGDENALAPSGAVQGSIQRWGGALAVADAGLDAQGRRAPGMLIQLARWQVKLGRFSSDSGPTVTLRLAESMFRT
jgi:hypothetical protein